MKIRKSGQPVRLIAIVTMLFMLFGVFGPLMQGAGATQVVVDQRVTLCHDLDTNDNLHLSNGELNALARAPYNYSEAEIADLASFCEARPSLTLDPGNDGVRITICHATGSTTNPYVVLTIPAAGVLSGHYGVDHQGGRDIIPAFTHNGTSYLAQGNQAALSNNCSVSVVPGVDGNVTLCHATGSTTNPYVLITISAAGAFNGHYDVDHQGGRDVIPAFTYNGTVYPAQGDQSILGNNCLVPGQPVVPNGTLEIFKYNCPDVKYVETDGVIGKDCKLGDVMFSVYLYGDGDDTVIAQGSTGADGVVSFSLAPGKYQVVEEMAPFTKLDVEIVSGMKTTVAFENPVKPADKPVDNPVDKPVVKPVVKPADKPAPAKSVTALPSTGSGSTNKDDLLVAVAGIATLAVVAYGVRKQSEA